MEEAALFGFGKFFNEFFLFFVEILWNFDVNRDDVRAALITAEAWGAMAGKFKVGAWLSAGWDFHSNLAVNGLNFNLSAKHCVGHRDCNFGKDKLALARESLVGADANLDVKVATLAVSTWGFTTLAAETDRLTIVNTGWNLELDLVAFDRDSLRNAEDCFLEVDRNASAIIATTTSCTETAAAEHSVNDILEATATEVEVKALAIATEATKTAAEWVAAAIAANTGMAELVVTTALGFIAQNRIGFVCFLELLFCLFVARVFVWVIFDSELTKSLFDFIIRCAFADA